MMMSGNSHVCFKHLALKRLSNERLLRRFVCDLGFSMESRDGGAYHAQMEEISSSLLSRNSATTVAKPNSQPTWSHFGVSPSIGLTSFMVDMAGALVSPRMSTPRLFDFVRGRVMADCASINDLIVSQGSKCGVRGREDEDVGRPRLEEGRRSTSQAGARRGEKKKKAKGGKMAESDSRTG
jgi:hypothetical protein